MPCPLSIHQIEPPEDAVVGGKVHAGEDGARRLRGPEGELRVAEQHAEDESEQESSRRARGGGRRRAWPCAKSASDVDQNIGRFRARRAGAGRKTSTAARRPPASTARSHVTHRRSRSCLRSGWANHPISRYVSSMRGNGNQSRIMPRNAAAAERVRPGQQGVGGQDGEVQSDGDSRDGRPERQHERQDGGVAEINHQNPLGGAQRDHLQTRIRLR